MKISVLGCGRWGSFLAWYSAKIGHEVTLYGRQGSARMARLETSGGNEYLTLPKSVRLTKDLSDAINFAEVVLISVGVQSLRGLCGELKALPGAEKILPAKKFLLCMKGLESNSGKRPTTIFNEVMNEMPEKEFRLPSRDDRRETKETSHKVTAVFDNATDAPAGSLSDKVPLTGNLISPFTGLMVAPKVVNQIAKVAVWAGPGHVQDFVRDIPNCMVIASGDEPYTRELAEIFKSPLIRFYYGRDLIGTEVGAAAKNVVGIAAGMLDGLDRACLKGALMARGTSELSRLVSALGGDRMTIYGLSHLGDYQATLFSEYGNNRRFGEDFILKRKFDKLAEGVDTAAAMMQLAKLTGEELPICRTVYEILHEGKDPAEGLTELFMRSAKSE